MRPAALVGTAILMTMIFYPVIGMSKQPALTKIGPTLHHPWGMDFLSEDTILVTERRGNLFQINLNTHSSDQISNVPEVYHKGQGGLLDVLVEGDWIYLCYSALLVGGSSTAIARARLDPAHQIVRSQSMPPSREPSERCVPAHGTAAGRHRALKNTSKAQNQTVQPRQPFDST